MRGEWCPVCGENAVESYRNGVLKCAECESEWFGKSDLRSHQDSAKEHGTDESYFD